MDGKKEMDERGGNRKGGAGEWKSVIIALIAGITAIVCVVIFSGSIVDYKKTSGAGGLTATGSASIDFESDLVVWRGSQAVSAGKRGLGRGAGFQFRGYFPALPYGI